MSIHPSSRRSPDYEAVLSEIETEIHEEFGKGTVASHIPALARVPPRQFGMSVQTIDDRTFELGSANRDFSIQSISKLYTLLLALGHVGGTLWRRVGREPSGNPFNSLVQLEYENGIPRNPFINAGALVVTDCLLHEDPQAKSTLLDTMRRLSGNPEVDYDAEVAASEWQNSDRNAAIAHFLRSHGNLLCDVDEVLDLYFHQCALKMSCHDLAKTLIPLANQGAGLTGNRHELHPRRVKRINSLMLTCGVYDAAGNFAFHVGIPCKSGVGGGIVGVIPNYLAVCVWSPELDTAGNSYVGTRALELFTTKTGLSIF